MQLRATLLLFLTFLLPTLAAFGCRSSLPPLPQRDSMAAAEVRRGESLLVSVDRIVDGGGNLGRFAAARERAGELGLADVSHSEWIDWFSLQRNFVIDLPGEDRDLVYIVAHYDKTDVNVLKFASLMVNGLIDELVAPSYVGEGAVDNATGVAIALELAAELRQRERHLSYRILLAGAEESGLRGTRAHVARMSDAVRESIRVAINVDSVGLAASENCITLDYSSEAWREEAMRAALEAEVPIDVDDLPVGASADVVPFMRSSFLRDFGRGLMFNLVGGLLPQRSWFTGRHRAPTLNFSACGLLDWSDNLAGTILMPVGRLHGPRDRRSGVDPVRLHEQYRLLQTLVERLERGDGPNGL